MDEFPKPLVIPDTYDTATQKSYLREYAERHFPIIKLRKLDRANIVVDELYQEVVDRRWKEPVDIRCYVQPDPASNTLTKYGMDQSRKILFFLPTVFLSDLGILGATDKFLIGDLISWGGDTYEIKDQSKDVESFFINTNIPFYITVSGDYYREGS